MRFARLLPYLGCSFAVGVFSGFNNFSLPLWLGGFISSYALISLAGQHARLPRLDRLAAGRRLVRPGLGRLARPAAAVHPGRRADRGAR